MIDRCQVCFTLLDSNELNLGKHPLPDHLLPIGVKPEKDVFAQQLKICPTCLTVHQIYPVEQEKVFPRTYHYRAQLTRDVISGMGELVDFIMETSETFPRTIVDVGCNDGSLLRLFKNREATCFTIGVEPTDALSEAEDFLDLGFNSYFSEAIANEIVSKIGHPDLITFTNVFAHINDLESTLKSLSILMGDQSRIIIENHYLGSILEKNQFDTFYLEHPRTYSATSFLYIADRLKAQVSNVSFPSRYGGNIRVEISRSGAEKSDFNPNIFPSERTFISRFHEFQSFFDSWKKDSKESLGNILSKCEFVIGKSLPARAVTLISALELDSRIMSAVFEQPSSPKVGKCVPGTDIPIKSDAEMPLAADMVMILWSWHISDEVLPYLRGLGFQGEVWSPMPKFRMV